MFNDELLSSMWENTDKIISGTQSGIEQRTYLLKEFFKMHNLCFQACGDRVFHMSWSCYLKNDASACQRQNKNKTDVVIKIYV